MMTGDGREPRFDDVAKVGRIAPGRVPRDQRRQDARCRCASESDHVPESVVPFVVRSLTGACAKGLDDVRSQPLESAREFAKVVEREEEREPGEEILSAHVEEGSEI